MIRARNLSKKYDGNKNNTLSNISFDLPDTGLVYFIGKSGAGKSTLMNLIGLMDEKYEGSLIVNGEELRQLDERKKDDYRFRTVSFAFQSYQAEDWETVRDNLLKALSITTLTARQKEERIRDGLRKVGLLDKESTIFKNLSGGEKKRISLVRALIRDCPILLLDEPLSNLNPALRKNITATLEEESRRRLVIVITHEKDEIPANSFVHELVNGNLHLIKSGRHRENVPATFSYQRKEFRGKVIIKPLLSLLKAKKEFLLIVLFSLMISLFSITFSFQLSSSVSRALAKSMSSYMDENSLVISKKDSTITDNGFSSVDYATLAKMKNRHKDEIISISTFYTSSLDAIFTDNQALELKFNKKTLPMEKFSLDHFLSYRMPEELPGKTIYGKSGNLEEEELILAMKEDQIKALYMMLFDSMASSIDEKTMEKLGNQLKGNIVELRLQANKSEWGYFHDYSFRIVGFLVDEKNYIVSPSDTFSEHFVLDIMHFEQTGEEEKSNPDKPWTLKKLDGFRLYPYREATFLKSFLEEEANNGYTLKMVREENYFSVDEKETHNHIAIIKDYLPKINLSEINHFIEKNSDLISSVSYSSPVYTYTASGYISGFAKPFFFSKYKEKLNQIEDDSAYSDKNLGSFQGSLIKEIPGVIKGDLLSSMNHDSSLSFITLNNSGIKASYGKNPKSHDEIGISKKMAEELFHSSSNALNKTLYTLTLDETVKANGKYKNHFTPGELKISGIYDSDRYAIYQDSLFPLCYSFSYGQLKPEETRIEQVIMKVDIEKHSTDYYLSLIRKYGDYEGSFPMYLMIQEIKKTLNSLSVLFLSFSILSLFSAASLLGLSLFLIISKDRKEIGILLSLGYSKKEIVRFYLSFSLFIGLVGFLLSMLLSLFAEKILSNTLNDLLSTYTFDIGPFLISFLVAIILSGSVGFLLSKRIRNFSVKDAFDASRQ